MSQKKVTVNCLVDGGRASGGPPIGPSVGPTGIPIMDVVNKINEQTKGFAGLKVPVRIEIDTTNRTFEVVVETPMASALLLKEAGVTKGSAEPNTKFVGNLSMEQVISVAKMKLSALNAVTLKTQVKIILGTAQSCGITVEGTHVKETMQRVNAGEYDNLLGEA